MNTVTFGTHRSYDDLQILLTGKTIGTPAPKVETIDLPGSDGVLDLTEFFDGTKYANRQLSFEFATKVHRSLFLQQFTAIQNLLHGKKMDIFLSDDPDWYYTGRVHVNEWKADKSVGRFTIDCDCEPFKHRHSAQAVRLCGKNLLNLDAAVNSRPAYWTKTATGYSFERGTSTGNGYLYFEIPVEKGKTYTFSALGTTFTGGAASLYVYKTFTGREIVQKVNSPFSLSFEAQETTTYVFCLVANSSTTTVNYTNIMAVEGTASAYAAFDKTVQTVTATFANTNRAAVPTIYVTSAMTVENGNFLAELSPGDNTLPDFAFFTGDNTLTFKGNGSALVKWTEGSL